METPTNTPSEKISNYGILQTLKSYILLLLEKLEIWKTPHPWKKMDKLRKEALQISHEMEHQKASEIAYGEI